MSENSKFEVRAVLRLTLLNRPSIVFSGRVLAGSIQPGMSIQFELQPGRMHSCPVASLEFIERVSAGESLVGLVCLETHAGEADRYSELCPPGTIIAVSASQDINEAPPAPSTL